MQFTYKLDLSIILATVQKIVVTDNFTVEQNQAVEQALHWYEQSMDFADALHLAGSLDADKFASFDKKFRNKAIALKTGVMIIEP